MRDNSISAVKGIGIILMVLVHASFPWFWGKSFIYMFHMPLFFFCSGYCFKKDYLNDSCTFATKRIKGLYWPFVKWGLSFLLLHNLFFYLNIYSDEYGFQGEVQHIYTSYEFFVYSFRVVSCMAHTEPLLGGYWFLQSLFFCSFIFYLTIRYIKNNVVGGAILLAICFLLLFFNINPPIIKAREFLSASFLLFGYQFKTMNLEFANKWWTIPLGVILVAIGTEYWQSSMLEMDWRTLFPYTATAVVGTILSLCLSKIIIRSKIIAKLFIFIGDHTIEILTWHFLCFKIVSLLIIFTYGLPAKQLGEFPTIHEYAYQGWWLLYFFVGVGLPIVTVVIANGLKTLIFKK